MQRKLAVSFEVLSDVNDMIEWNANMQFLEHKSYGLYTCLLSIGLLFSAERNNRIFGLFV